MWKNIDGFPGYQVSSDGRVRSCKNFHGSFNNEYHELRPRINPNGYEIVTLYDENHIGKQCAVHRLVAMMFIPTNDETLYIDHLDGNKRNNDISNLEWVTSKENSVRACKSGLYEPAFIATRTPVIVTDIWTDERMYFKGLCSAARRIGYSPSILSRVANGLSEKVGHYYVEFAGNEDLLLYDFN